MPGRENPSGQTAPHAADSRAALAAFNAADVLAILIGKVAEAETSEAGRSFGGPGTRGGGADTGFFCWRSCCCRRGTERCNCAARRVAVAVAAALAGRRAGREIAVGSDLSCAMVPVDAADKVGATETMLGRCCGGWRGGGGGGGVVTEANSRLRASERPVSRRCSHLLSELLHTRSFSFVASKSGVSVAFAATAAAAGAVPVAAAAAVVVAVRAAGTAGEVVLAVTEIVEEGVPAAKAGSS